MRTPIQSKLLLVLIYLSTTCALLAQPTLDAYIDDGLKNNMVLQQRNIGLEKATLALKIANGMFAPSVGLIGNYQSGKGGRSIAIPVGDLLNPVYATLNQLTDSQQFPQIANVNENFFPFNFYDVKVRTSMPLLNTDLIYNRKIQQQQTLMQEFELETYKRQLVRDIKVAYYNYLSALKGIAVYESALERATEGKRVNESLLNNGSGLPAYVLRSNSEIETTKAQLIDAQQRAQNAKLYFNFLLNRAADDSIAVEYPSHDVVDHALTLIDDQVDVQKREELLQLQAAVSINETVLKMNKSYWTPRLSGFLDLGSQAQNLNWNSDARYYLFGFTAEIPLFAGFTNRHKIDQASLDIKNAELAFANTSRQLQMSGVISRNSLVSAYQNYLSAQKQLEAAQSYQRLIDKGYAEGINTFIEAVDARNQLTSAQLQLNINLFNVLVAEANLERETAQYSLSKN